MTLLIQPDAGVAPLLSAVKKAKKSIEILVFRFDLTELEKALEAAVTRGVQVHALISHTNHGGERRLRDLESALLAAGVTVSRTADDLVRYHGKMMIVDRRSLYLLGFNYTHLEVSKSRSFGFVVTDPRLVQEAIKLFEADTARQPYTAGSDAFLVSPENARTQLAAFIKGARTELLIYDPKISDPLAVRQLLERAKDGVEIRILGRIAKKGAALHAEKLPKLRLHVRAMLRDGRELFVGSQSLRALELDRRREVGLIVRNPHVARQFRSVFEADWALTKTAVQEQEQVEKGERKADSIDALTSGSLVQGIT